MSGMSSYNSQRTREAVAILRELGTPCIIHQPSYSMLNRWIEEDGLLDTLADLGLGSIVFSPLAQGMLTTKYLNGIPDESRAAQGKSLRTSFLSEDNLARIRGLNGIAERRGQTLAQMALAWVLRGGRVTSALIGASRPEQVVDCVGAIKNLSLHAGGACRDRQLRRRGKPQHLGRLGGAAGTVALTPDPKSVVGEADPVRRQNLRRARCES